MYICIYTQTHIYLYIYDTYMLFPSIRWQNIVHAQKEKKSFFIHNYSVSSLFVLQNHEEYFYSHLENTF